MAESSITFQQKKDAERLAVQWVERLMEPTTPPSLLEEAVQFIEPRHFNDVIEERSITKLCGWPLCGHTLTNVPSAKYHVSMKQRKVIDLTERKKFCSSECYRSSNFIASQIPSQPVWARNSSTTKVKLKFLESSNHDKVSAQTRSTKLMQFEPHTTPTADPGVSTGNNSMEKLLMESVQNPNSAARTSVDRNEVMIVERLQRVNLQDYSSDSDDNNDCDRDKTIEHQPQPDQQEGICQEDSGELSDSPKARITQALEHWYTPATRKWLRLHYGIESDKGDESKDIENTTTTVTEESSSQGSGEKVGLLDEEVWLPPVHGSEITKIQRNIFMQQLRSNSSSVLPLVRLSLQNILPDMNELVRTFRLSNNSIVFKPNEWKLLICIFVVSLRVAGGVDFKENENVQKWLKANSLTYNDFLYFVSIVSP